MLIAQDIPYQNLMLTADCEIVVKRLDLVHPNISGNKFFKLKLNLQAAQEQGQNLLISFGGAYSNHIHALAHAAQAMGMQSLGIIRGQELANQPLNPTLQAASDCGMRLQFVSREQYRHKHSPEFLNQLAQQYPNACILPEGGSNAWAVLGCKDIISEADRQQFDTIVCAVGTGGTIAGIINASAAHQSVIGYAALQSEHLQAAVSQWTDRDNWRIVSDTVFGGYGRFDARLQDLIAHVYQAFQIPLEPIYTAKALYRLQQDVLSGRLGLGQRILFIHTGGLQAFASPDNSQLHTETSKADKIC